MHFVIPHALSEADSFSRSGVAIRSVHNFGPNLRHENVNKSSSHSDHPHRTRASIGTNDSDDGLLLFFITLLIFIIFGIVIFFVYYYKKMGYFWTPKCPSGVSRVFNRVTLSISNCTSPIFARFSNDREHIIGDTNDTVSWPNQNSNESSVTISGRRSLGDQSNSHDLTAIADSAKRMTEIAGQLKMRERSVQSCLGIEDLQDEESGADSKRNNRTSQDDHTYETIQIKAPPQNSK